MRRCASRHGPRRRRRAVGGERRTSLRADVANPTVAWLDVPERADVAAVRAGVGWTPTGERIEAALREAVRHARRLPHRDRLPPDRRRRQAAAAGRSRSWPRRSAGNRVSDDVVLGGVACELVHLGSLYHDDVMDEADDPPRRRDRQRPLGQPAGHPRRRLPAGPGVGDRRLARHRGRRAAGPHHRPAVRGPDRRAPPHLRHGARRRTSYLASIDGKTASLFGTAARIGGIVAGLDRPTIDALTEFGNAYGMVFQIVDDVLDLTATDEQLGKPAGHDLVEGVYTLPVLRTLPIGRSAATSCATARQAARAGRARQGARDRALERGRRERDRHGRGQYVERARSSARRLRRRPGRRRPAGGAVGAPANRRHRAQRRSRRSLAELRRSQDVADDRRVRGPGATRLIATPTR